MNRAAAKQIFAAARIVSFLPFSDYENIINHNSGNDHEGTESVDDNIFPMFFEKVAHRKSSL